MIRKVRNICLQSTLRQRLRTLFLLLLVGLISFAFISRAVEYLVVDRETDRLAGYYRIIGFLEEISPTNYVTPDSLIDIIQIHNAEDNKIRTGAELISTSQYIGYEDRRRACSGVLQGLYNVDLTGGYGIYGYGVNGDVMVYGELSKMSSSSIGYEFILAVDQVLAGYPEYVQEGINIRVRHYSESPGELDAVYNSLQVGERYFIKAYYDPKYSRYTWQNASDTLFLRPLNDSGLWFLPVEPGAAVDFSDPALAMLAEDFHVMEENLYALRVISTKDMSAIPHMQESFRDYYLTEGRWLNRADDINGRRVCVLHWDFAELRGLSLGDTLTLKLRDLKASFFGYIVPGEDWGVWQEYETHTEEFEIVGMYGMLDTIHSADTLRIFIPDSCMPAGYGEGYWPWNGLQLYSFVLSSPWEGEAFLAEYQEILVDLGLQVTIMDTGWKNFQASVVPMKRSAAMSVVVFSLVLVLALGLAAFLYLRQRRRDFAILRSLGVPKQTAIRQMLQPMALVGAISILMGGLAAWFYALGKASKTLASLQGPEGVGPSSALSPAWLVGLCILAFVLLLLFTAIGTVMTARSPVLELLQGAAKQAGGKRKLEADTVPERQKAGAKEMQSETKAISLGEIPVSTRKSGFAQVPRYILRHTRRAPLKSILTVAIALSFTLSLGWMSWTMERNEAELDRLYRTMQVEAMIIPTSSITQDGRGGIIRRLTVDTILRSGLVNSAYLEGAAIARVTAKDEEGTEDSERTENAVLRAIDQPEQFFSGNGSDITVEYAQGWDESFFTLDWTEETVRPVLLPTDMMERLQLQLGETVLIPKRNSFIADTFIIAGHYAGFVKGRDNANPILLPISALEQLQGNELLYISAEFVLDPAKNRELPEFKKKMEALFKTNVGTIPLTLLFWDEELTQVVEPLEKNLQLMEILFPVTVAVSVLIAAGLAVLLMFQAAREASIMRVLGTTKGRARAILCGEQLFLCIIGLLLGLALLIALRQEAAAVLTGPALICALLYFAGVICGSIPSAVSVTNRMPLELLQVKE